MDIETATAAPRSPVSCAITIRGHHVIQDKPPALGGHDEGPMASELLLASLLSCQLSTFAKVKAKRGSDAEVESVTAECGFNDAGDIDTIHVIWSLRAGDENELPTLLRLTDRICTISRALKVPIESRFEKA